MNQTISFFLSVISLVAIVYLYIRLKHLAYLHKKSLTLYDDLKEVNKNLQKDINTIITSLPAPAMIINTNGIIISANEEAKKITENNQLEYHSYIVSFKQPEFIEAIQQIQKNKKGIVKEIGLKNRLYLVSFIPLINNEVIFIFFKDITDKKEIEKVKKELISNMSHELKTPLTVIQGYIDTLYDEVNSPVAKQHLDTVKKHTERLTNIVNDLLKLSELEEVKIEFQKFDIKDIIESVSKIFEKKVSQKGLTLKLDIENVYIEGDPIKIEELLINLLDNAIRYTEKGEINIKTKKEDNYLIISIRDTGIGIPEHCLPRIFERFYVVDKSRSRETGGTGLGLAIVKHIVMLHNGTIDVKSSLGTGTEFIISLPVKQSGS